MKNKKVIRSSQIKIYMLTEKVSGHSKLFTSKAKLMRQTPGLKNAFNVMYRHNFKACRFENELYIIELLLTEK